MTLDPGLYKYDGASRRWSKLGTREDVVPPPPVDEVEVTHTPVTWTSTTSKVTFTTTTSEPTYRAVEYGTTPAMGTTDTFTLTTPRTDHSAVIPAGGSWPANTEMHAQITFTTEDGRSVDTPVIVARTQAEPTTPTPGNPPPPVTGGVFTPDRTMYPNGTGAWSHLPPWQDWPHLYLLPTNSTYQAPAGARVVRGPVLNLARTDRYLIFCPEAFVNVERGVRISNGSYIVFGLQQENTRFIGRAGAENLPWYASDAEGGFRLPGPRPGKTRCDTTQRVTPNDENRGAYITGAGSTGPRTFRAFEGTWFKGDWTFEGMDIAFQGENTTTELVLNGFRHDRVSVCYSRDASGSFTSKSGGDALQVFDHGGGGHPDKFFIRGMTVGATSIQGLFTRPGSGRYTTFDAENVIIRGSDKWGPSSEAWWNTMPITNKRYVRVHVVPSAGRSRDSTIEPAASWPNISTANIADTLPANEAGLAYRHIPR